MIKGQKLIFKNPEILNEMLELRKQGWSTLELGKKYNCNHTTVMYQIMKNCPEYKGYASKLRTQTIPKKGHCPKCDLLLTSEFFCEYCKDLKSSKSEKGVTINGNNYR